jgi:hypothetical protein
MKLDFDLTSWGGIAALAMFLVSSLKWALPKLVGNREPIFSVCFGILLAVGAHLSHAMIFKSGLEGWIQTIIGGLAAGIAAQVGHDKAMNPLLSFFGAKKDDAAPAPDQKKEDGDGKKGGSP